MPTNTQVLLDHRPADKVSPANFRIAKRRCPGAGARADGRAPPFLSLDPYMRGRLSEAKTYAKPQE